MRVSQRAQRIDPFYVMEMAKAAQAIAASARHTDRPMVFLNIGEPDFTAPPLVQAAADKAIRDGRTQYTNALGLDSLRERISEWYGSRFGVAVPARRIVVTAGASAALQLACLALVQAGDDVLMPDPSYPCNRHFVAAAGATARLVPSTAAQRFQLDAVSVCAHWNARTRGVLLASPSNPTGTSIEPQELRAIVQAVRARAGVTIVDEIYLPLSYDTRFGGSALALGEDVISVNSFSKYFSMTGWRLGWLVLPPALVEPVERLAQNLYICPSAVAQHAAVACFESQTLALCEQRRGELQRRRDRVLEGLERVGLPVPVPPDGAFYAWADCSAHADSSWALCHDLLERAHLVLTPGRDFGPAQAERFLRLSFAGAADQLDEAIERLARALQAGQAAA